MKSWAIGFQAWIPFAAALAVAILGVSKAQGQSAVQAWVQRYNGLAESDDRARKVVVDASGNVIVVGYSNDGITGPDWLVIKYSGAGLPLWTNRYNGPGNGDDHANAVAVDGSGNVFVTGDSIGSDSAHDYATIAYSGEGVPLWTNRYNGPDNNDDKARAVGVDDSGNVFVTGYSFGSGSGNDYAIIKYSGAGVALWTNLYDGPGSGYDEAADVAVDGNGNVLVTGLSYGSGSGYDYATIKYSGAGVPLWTNRFSGPGNYADYPLAVALDGNGNVFVTGDSVGSGSGSDCLTIAYSSAGLPLWTNRYSAPGYSDSHGAAVAVDGHGTVFVTGNSYGGASYYDYATIAYSPSGVPLWTNRYNGLGNQADRPKAVAADTNGNVFVTGFSDDGASGYDYVTIKYSGVGVPLWTNRYGGSGRAEDLATGLAVDGSGNVFVTGDSSADCVTIAYSNAGVPLWTNRYNGPAKNDDQANAVALDGSGNVFVTGSSPGNGSYLDYTTIAYSSAGVGLWTNRYNGIGNGNDVAQAVVVDGTGNVIVTGYSWGAAGFEGGYNVYATIGYSGTGVPLWTNRYNGSGNRDDFARAVAVDGSGHVIVTGTSYGGGSRDDYATIAYSSASAVLWTQRYNGPGNGDDNATAVAVDGSGNVFVTGTSATVAYSSTGAVLWVNVSDIEGTAIALDGSGNVFVTGGSIGSSGSRDYATIKYSGTGVPIWTNRYNGPGNGDDRPNAVAVDGAGNVIVTGTSYDSSSAADYATIKYSSAGVPLWTNRYNGPGNGDDYARCVVADGWGNVFVAGRSLGSNGAYDYATIKYAVSQQPPPELLIQKATPDAIRICWPTNAANYVLESKDQLSTSVSWTPVVTPVEIEGGNFCITNRTDSSNARFYRLRSGN